VHENENNDVERFGANHAGDPSRCDFWLNRLRSEQVTLNEVYGSRWRKRVDKSTIIDVDFQVQWAVPVHVRVGNGGS